MRPLLLLFIACLPLLASCATPTPYHAEKGGIGFTEERAGDLVYRIKFHGDQDTSLDTVQDMLLLRMAELTHQNGMDHFTVVLDEAVCDTIVKTSPTTTCTYERPVDATFPFLALAEDFSDVGPATKEYEARAMFIIGKGRVVSDTTDNYVAAEVISRLSYLKQ